MVSDMFEAKLDDVALLRESIATISEFIDEAEMHITKEGIELVSSDRAVVAVIDFFLNSSAFSEYKYESDRKIGINLVNLLQILRRSKPDDVLRIKLEDNKLLLVLEGASTRRFWLPLIDVTKEETPDLKKLEAGFTAKFTVNSELFNAGIEDAELIADSIIFTLRKDQLMMKAESDSSSTQMELPSGTESLKIIDIEAPVRARYSMDYLKKIFKARKLADNASVSIATDYPIKIQFEVPQKMRLACILAPRVED